MELTSTDELFLWVAMRPASSPPTRVDDGYTGSGVESDNAGLKLSVLGEERLSTYRPAAGEVCIVIRARGATKVTLRDGWAAVLELELGGPGGLATPASVASRLTDADADTIVAFALRHRHCSKLAINWAGNRRYGSKAVATVLAEMLERPYRWTQMNASVASTMRVAAMRVAAQAGGGRRNSVP